MDRKYIFFLLCAAFVLAVVVSPWASSWPDGLERVAEDRGFIHKAEGQPVVSSPLPDYLIPGIKNEKVSTAVAGAVGTLLVFGVAYGLAALIGAKTAGKKGHGR